MGVRCGIEFISRNYSFPIKGQEVGPLESMINNLNKALSAKQDEIGELEQQWLKEQNELVLRVNERDELANSVTRLQKQLSILAQKKLRLDSKF